MSQIFSTAFLLCTCPPDFWISSWNFVTSSFQQQSFSYLTKSLHLLDICGQTTVSHEKSKQYFQRAPVRRCLLYRSQIDTLKVLQHRHSPHNGLPRRCDGKVCRLSTSVYFSQSDSIHRVMKPIFDEAVCNRPSAIFEWLALNKARSSSEKAIRLQHPTC